MMERDDWIVADARRWRREDPLRELNPSNLTNAEWQQVVETTGYTLNPETLLMARPSKRGSEREPSTLLDPDLTVAAPVKGECLHHQIDFLAAVLVRRLEEQRCRNTPARSRAALRARKLKPESLGPAIAALVRQIEGLGPAGMIKVGEIMGQFNRHRPKRLAPPDNLRGGSA